MFKFIHMNKINFTKEHLARLQLLVVSAVFSGMRFTAKLGAEYNVCDLMDTAQISTLEEINGKLKSSITKVESTDEWSLTNYQQEKLARLKKEQELLHLLIGYKKYKAQEKSARDAAKALRQRIKELEEEAKTPQERLEELKASLKEQEDFFNLEESSPIVPVEPQAPETTV